MAPGQPTRFTDAFGVSVPAMQAPMAMIAGPRLVAAAANAGALGNLPIWFLPPEMAQDQIRQTRALTDADFAVNLRADLAQTALITMAAAEGVTLFNLFWGDPAASLPAIRDVEGRLIATVGDIDGAAAAIDAGAAAIVAQGVEAGGHVYGAATLPALLTDIAKIAGDVPIVAAGGIVEHSDMSRAFDLGASAVVLGTCLIVTDEADAHPDYRQALLDAGPDATVLSTCFNGMWPDAPHRVLRNSTYEMWSNAGCPTDGSRPGEDDVVAHGPHGMAIPRYSAAGATSETTGDIEAMALYAGTGVDRIADTHSVADVIRSIVATA